MKAVFHQHIFGVPFLTFTTFFPDLLSARLLVQNGHTCTSARTCSSYLCVMSTSCTSCLSLKVFSDPPQHLLPQPSEPPRTDTKLLFSLHSSVLIIKVPHKPQLLHEPSVDFFTLIYCISLLEHSFLVPHNSAIIVLCGFMRLAIISIML